MQNKYFFKNQTKYLDVFYVNIKKKSHCT